MHRLDVVKKYTCMYAVVACKSMESFGCMSMPFGCMSMDRLGACLTVGSLPDSR